MTSPLGQFHALVDGRASGDAVHVQNLESAQAQRDEDLAIELGTGVLEHAMKLVVQTDLPSENTENQGGSQIAIRKRKSANILASEQIIRMRVVAFNSHQHVEGSLPSR